MIRRRTQSEGNKENLECSDNSFERGYESRYTKRRPCSRLILNHGQCVPREEEEASGLPSPRLTTES